MIFYCESRIFSGQERMFLTAACSVSKKNKCTLIINESNEEGIIFCENNGSFHELIKVSNFNPKFSSLLIWFRWKRIFSFTKILLKFKKRENILCISQGRIESGNIGVLSAKLAGFKIISYIPMVHSHEEMGSKGFDAKLKNSLCDILYRLPDAFITISHAVSSELRKKCNTDIYIVENFVQQKKIFSVMENPPYFEDHNRYKLILPGRLLNKQKGQVDLIKAIALMINNLDKKIVCYIVGDGPSKQSILDEIQARDLSKYIYLLGNRPDILHIMNGCDLVVLPSRFEGVPLVMLEAALLNKNIVASSIIGFKEYLYDCDLFQPSDPNSIADVLLKQIMDKTSKPKYRETLVNLLSRHEKMFIDDFHLALETIERKLFR